MWSGSSYDDIDFEPKTLSLQPRMKARKARYHSGENQNNKSLRRIVGILTSYALRGYTPLAAVSAH